MALLLNWGAIMIVQKALITIVSAILFVAIGWPLFGINVAVENVYYCIGAVWAVVVVTVSFEVLASTVLSPFDRFSNELRISVQGRTAHRLLVGFGLVYDVVMSLAYWPSQHIMAFIQSVPRDAGNRYLQLAVSLNSTNLPIGNAISIAVVNLSLVVMARTQPGLQASALFVVFVHLCMVGTVLWLLSSLIFPIERNLRLFDGPRRVFLKVLVFVLAALLNMTLIVYAYRTIFFLPEASLPSVIRDLLTGAQLNPQMIGYRSSVITEVTAGHYLSAWGAATTVDVGLLTTFAFCIVFTYAIASRAYRLLFSRSTFTRTEAESANAALLLLNAQDFKAAAPYVKELPPNHLLHSVASVREDLAEGRFDEAITAVDRMLSRSRAVLGLESLTDLTMRDRIMVVGDQVLQMATPKVAVPYLAWMVHNEHAEIRDILGFELNWRNFHGSAEGDALVEYGLELGRAAPPSEVGRRHLAVLDKVEQIGNWPFTKPDWDGFSALDRVYLDMATSAQVAAKLTRLIETDVCRSAPHDWDTLVMTKYMIDTPKQWMAKDAYLQADKVDQLMTLGMLAGIKAAIKDDPEREAEITKLHAELAETWLPNLYHRYGMSEAAFGKMISSATHVFASQVV